MFIIELIRDIILGIVEELTEFAPVSSTGHMILVNDMWLKSSELLGSQSAFIFKAVIQLESVFAAAWVFRKRFLEILHIGKHKRVKGDNNQQKHSKPRRLDLLHVLVGMVPTGILDLLFDNFIEEHLFSMPTIMIGLFVGAICMIIADRYSAKVKNPQTVDRISYFQVFVIGISQAIAIRPGFSRSGSTISTGVLVKLDRKAASNFIFIMAVLVMLATSSLSLLKHYQDIQIADMPFYILGSLAAFTVRLIAIKTFLHLINKIKLIPFAIYKIVLVISIAILYFGFGVGKSI